MKTAKIEVFKAGVYGDNPSRIWSQTEVQEVIDNYEAGYRSSPVILGHNDWDGKEKPAYGWATNFSLSDDNILVAEIEYNDELGEMIKNKMYTRVSMELTKKIEMYDRVGGKTGAYALAIAFLGSNQPAVSGLEPISFSIEDGENGDSFEFESDIEIKDDNTEEHFNTENKEENGTILQTESENDLENPQDKESFMTEQEIKALQDKAEKFDSLSATQAENDEKFKAVQKENADFKLELKEKTIASFMADNAKKIAPVVSEQVQAFLRENDDSVCESFKKIMSALPENALFTKQDDEINKDEPIDSDEKFALQAKADLTASNS